VRKLLLVLGCLALLVPEAGANGGLFSRARSRNVSRVNVRVQNVRQVQKVQQVKVQQVNVVEQVRVQKVVQQVAVVKQAVVPVFVPAAVVYPAQAYLSYKALSYGYAAPAVAPAYDPCAATAQRVRELELQLREIQLRQQLQAPVPGK